MPQALQTTSIGPSASRCRVCRVKPAFAWQRGQLMVVPAGMVVSFHEWDGWAAYLLCMLVIRWLVSPPALDVPPVYTPVSAGYGFTDTKR